MGGEGDPGREQDLLQRRVRRDGSLRGAGEVDFSLSEDQRDIEKSVLKLCSARLNDGVFEDDERGVFPERKWKQCAEFGILGLPISREYGGLGQDMLTTALAVRALGYGCRDEGLVFSLCAHMLTCAVPIQRFGTEEQKRRYLPGISRGESIGGNAISESEAGSDVSSMATSVVKEEGSYILNGAKIFSTNAPVARLLVIYARHPGGMKTLDVSSFIVEKNSPGLTIGQVFKKMGLRTSTLSEVILEGCKVPEANLLGRERMGMEVFNHSMLWERIVMAAYHVGSMEQQFESAHRYASTRRQFGKRIIEFDRVSDRLISMKMRMETSRLLLYKSCWDYDNGRADAAEAAMLKLHASESKVKNSLDAVQIFGAYGYVKESEVEKQLRDSIASTIYSGTSEIQKKIIAEEMGRP
jgi:alkylation response protein AidB-like acyl-CoA dehydrogenase